MTAAIMFRSAVTRVLCRKTCIWAIMTIGSIALGCSLESTLDSLAKQFPKRESELNRLIAVWQALRTDIGLEGYTRYCTSAPCVYIGKSEEPMSLDVAREKFPKSNDRFEEITSLSRNLNLDYFALRHGEYFAVVMEGGGALNPDKRYIFVPKGSLPQGAVRYFRPIPTEDRWYAFVG